MSNKYNAKNAEEFRERAIADGWIPATPIEENKPSNEITKIKIDGTDFIVGIVIAIFIRFLWQGLEIIIVGEIQPSVADTIIYYILISSIILNYAIIKGLVKYKNN